MRLGCHSLFFVVLTLVATRPAPVVKSETNERPLRYLKQPLVRLGSDVGSAFGITKIRPMAIEITSGSNSVAKFIEGDRHFTTFIIQFLLLRRFGFRSSLFVSL